MFQNTFRQALFWYTAYYKAGSNSHLPVQFCACLLRSKLQLLQWGFLPNKCACNCSFGFSEVVLLMPMNLAYNKGLKGLQFWQMTSNLDRRLSSTCNHPERCFMQKLNFFFIFFYKAFVCWHLYAQVQDWGHVFNQCEVVCCLPALIWAISAIQ